MNRKLPPSSFLFKYKRDILFCSFIFFFFFRIYKFKTNLHVKNCLILWLPNYTYKTCLPKWLICLLVKLKLCQGEHHKLRKSRNLIKVHSANKNMASYYLSSRRNGRYSATTIRNYNLWINWVFSLIDKICCIVLY